MYVLNNKDMFLNENEIKELLEKGIALLKVNYVNDVSEIPSDYKHFYCTIEG